MQEQTILEWAKLDRGAVDFDGAGVLVNEQRGRAKIWPHDQRLLRIGEVERHIA
jgi:hypothetical protein